MTSYTFDTNIIIFLLRGNESLSSKICYEIKNDNKIILNPISYYEILRGLLTTGNKIKLNKFLEFCDLFEMLNVTKKTFYHAAEIYASLKKNGCIVEDADILIAALCLENDLVLVTNNKKHFDRISGISCEDWSYL